MLRTSQIIRKLLRIFGNVKIIKKELTTDLFLIFALLAI